MPFPLCAAAMSLDASLSSHVLPRSSHFARGAHRTCPTRAPGVVLARRLARTMGGCTTGKTLKRGKCGKRQWEPEAPSRGHSERAASLVKPNPARDSKIALPSKPRLLRLVRPTRAAREVASGRTASARDHLQRGQQSSRRTVARHTGASSGLPNSSSATANKRKNQDGPHAPPGARIPRSKSTATVMRTTSARRTPKPMSPFQRRAKAMSVKIKNVFGKQIMGGVFAKSPFLL